jgi:hypothetical protein
MLSAIAVTTVTAIRVFLRCADDHGYLVEVRRDFKGAAERFDVTAQVAHMHVTALFKLCHGGLVNRECCSDFLLRERERALRNSSSVIASRSSAAFAATRVIARA